MCFITSSTGLVLLLSKVRREGPGPREGVHAAPRFGAIGAVTQILPRVGIPMRIVEDWCRGEAYRVCVVSGGSEALWWYCTVGSMAILSQAVGSAERS